MSHPQRPRTPSQTTRKSTQSPMLLAGIAGSGPPLSTEPRSKRGARFSSPFVDGVPRALPVHENRSIFRHSLQPFSVSRIRKRTVPRRTFTKRGRKHPQREAVPVAILKPRVWHSSCSRLVRVLGARAGRPPFPTGFPLKIYRVER